MDEAAPLCRICGEPKYRGTINYGGSRGTEVFWMCGSLQYVHDEILAYGRQPASSEEDDEVQWDEDEMEWDEV